ncbi:MAG: hypothetical protein AABX11_06520 [Nanoarchaeota archaeon]
MKKGLMKSKLIIVSSLVVLLGVLIFLSLNNVPSFSPLISGSGYLNKSVADTCNDSDGGRDYFNAGTLDDGSEYSDYCDSGDVDAGIEPSGDVIEYFCENGRMSYEFYNCPYGCENGRCKPYCVDSDGYNMTSYFIKGDVTGVSPDGAYKFKDYCAGNRVVENYCGDVYPAVYNGYDCPSGCAEGACKERCPNNSNFQLSPKFTFCYAGQVCNNSIELLLYDYPVSSLRGFLKYPNKTVIKEIEFANPKENKYVATIQILNPIGNYSVQIIDNNCILHQFNITTLNFEGTGFKIIKPATGNKITLAYNSKYFNLSDIEEISKVTTGLNGQEGLFNISPILKYVNNFEIVAITLPEDSSLETEAIINHFAPDINRRFILDVPLIVSDQRIPVNPGYLKYAIKPWHVNDSTHSLIPNLFEQQYKDVVGYFAHEFGHAFSNNGGLLQDEYRDTCTIINDCGDSFTTQGPIINSPNLDNEGCPKWCNGELDSTKPNYEDYIEVKDCLGRYFDVDNDWVYLDSGLPPSLRQIRECLGYIITANGKEIGYKYDSTYFTWDLGKNCLTGTGCYFTANKVMDWRSQEDSIMNSMNMDFGYGKVSEQVIENKILELIS